MSEQTSKDDAVFAALARRVYYVRNDIYKETVTQFSKRVNAKKQDIKKWENPRIKESINAIIPLYEIGIDTNWLLSGKGNSTRQEPTEKPPKEVAEIKKQVKLLKKHQEDHAEILKEQKEELKKLKRSLSQKRR